MSFVHHCRLRFADTDASGRIHHAALFRYFEAAEAEFFRSLGIPYSNLDRLGVRFPRVHVEADFTGSLVDDDPLAIAVAVERVGQSSFTLAFAVTVNQEQRARGKIVACSMDPLTQRACPIPTAFAQILQQNA